MNHDDEHDHHLATAVAASFPPGVTTAGVNSRVDEIIDEFEKFRDRVDLRVRQIAVIAGIALVTALAAGIDLVVNR